MHPTKAPKNNDGKGSPDLGAPQPAGGEVTKDQHPLTKRWLDEAFHLEELAFHWEQLSDLWVVHRFTSVVLQIKQLLNCFRRKSGIEVEGGVQEQLKLDTRSAVYQRFEHIGLKAQDFIADNANLDGLLKKSEVCRDLHREIQKRIKRYKNIGNS